MPLPIEDYARIGDCRGAALIPVQQATRASEKGERPAAVTQVKILVVDVGGSHVKCVATDHKSPVIFKSGPKLTPGRMVKSVLKITKGWRFDAVSIGYPGVVRRGKVVREPHNLGSGWVGFDFQAAFERPVKTINDAAMQALGGYEGGTMLFLGLGTGLGSALIVDGVIAAMELGHLHCAHGHNYEHYLGEKGRKRLGNKRWRGKVEDVVKGFRKALLPDDIVLGGGNVAHLKRLPPQTRRGDNAYAFLGGFRLWERQDRNAGVVFLRRHAARPRPESRRAEGAAEFVGRQSRHRTGHPTRTS